MLWTFSHLKVLKFGEMLKRSRPICVVFKILDLNEMILCRSSLGMQSLTGCSGGGVPDFHEFVRFMGSPGQFFTLPVFVAHCSLDQKEEILLMNHDHMLPAGYIYR